MQVSRQGAKKAVELSQCRSKLQRAEHMLTAAYAANAAMQVRLQQVHAGLCCVVLGFAVLGFAVLGSAVLCWALLC